MALANEVSEVLEGLTIKQSGLRLVPELYKVPEAAVNTEYANPGKRRDHAWTRKSEPSYMRSVVQELSRETLEVVVLSCGPSPSTSLGTFCRKT